jgi:hypothetical protein
MTVAYSRPMHCALQLAAIGLAAVSVSTFAHAQAHRFDALANAPFSENRPTPETIKLLKDELLFQRGTQVYLWAMPLINTLGMKTGSEKTFGAGYNVLPVWKKRLDARTLVTTPNSDVIYAMTYLDVGRDGPLVFEAPPLLQGIILDFWQRPIPGPMIAGQTFIGDVGFFGPDLGKGGKFLILPPGYDEPVPDGYFPYRSATNNVFVFLRSFYQDPKNLTPAVALMEQVKIYPLADAAGAKAMEFPDASGVPVNMLPASDASAFDQLKMLVDSEVAEIADPAWRGMLASIGIEKGKPFAPDDDARAILDRAARTAYKTSRVLAMEDVVDGVSYRVYPDRQWLNPMASGQPFDLAWVSTTGGYVALDARTNYFTNYYSFSPGMISRIPGKGANYMAAWTDGDGDLLSGGQNYRLKLPPNVPAANFWSVTLYEAENSSGLANGQPFPSLGSRDKPVQEEDGATELYLGPVAPAGKERNWLATVPGKGYFAILRLYSPTEAAFVKSWKPGDIEKAE